MDYPVEDGEPTVVTHQREVTLFPQAASALNISLVMVGLKNTSSIHAGRLMV